MEDRTPLADRRPWVAALASLFCTGLGHVYAGRLVRGVVVLVLVLLVPPTIALLSRRPPSRAALFGILGAGAFLVLVHLFAIFDAWRVARGASRPFRGGRTHRTGFYALFLLVGLLYPVGASLWVRERFLEAFRIPTASMSPGIAPGDRILVQKAPAGELRLTRGDIVVYRVPSEGGRHFVKRVIGLPGERVMIRRGAAWVDGRSLARGEVPPAQTDAPRRTAEEWADGRSWTVWVAQDSADDVAATEVVVPAAHVYVLGDDRATSRDSRVMGPVPIGDIVGRASYRYPGSGEWSRIGVLR